MRKNLAFRLQYLFAMTNKISQIISLQWRQLSGSGSRVSDLKVVEAEGSSQGGDKFLFSNVFHFSFIWPNGLQ